MTGFGLVTYAAEHGPAAGIVVGERLYDLARLCGDPAFGSVRRILERWDESLPVIERAAHESERHSSRPSSSAHLLPPVDGSPAIFCAGANYLQHIRNMERQLGAEPAPHPREGGGLPFHFLKAPQCAIGSGRVVAAPSLKLDWEGELVAVIGRRARNVPVEQALEHVAGYTIGNDLSARDLAFRGNLPPTNIFHHSWIGHKSFEHAAPLGPMIVPAGQVGDVADLRIVTRVNGTVRQDGSCGEMIFSVAEQIAYLSSLLTLIPGDLVMTGTPAGAGSESGEFLSPGDRVSVTIDSLGTLETSIR